MARAAREVAEEAGPATTGRPSAADLLASPDLNVLYSRLTAERARSALAIVTWLTNSKRQGTIAPIIDELCARFLQAGLPLDRYGSSTTMITADSDAVGRLWERDRGTEERIYVAPEENDPEYLASPFREAAETGRVVELWLPDTPDERFGIVKSLKVSGFVHYLCAPMVLTNEGHAWVTFATRRAVGFCEQDLLLIAFVLPALQLRIDGRVGWMALDKLLRTYVGDEPHDAILAGRAKRGQVSTITAAMLVADLRDSTGHMADLTALQAVGLFNDLFDRVVPSIDRNGGEVLKYLGDGLLAIFRDDYGRDASDRAVRAALDALEGVAAGNRARPDQRPLEVGIAVHYGEVAYGNVGSGSRLDFTVIGQDVALATRIAGLNGPLGCPLLLSDAIAHRTAFATERRGAYPARGFAEPVAVYELTVPPHLSAE